MPPIVEEEDTTKVVTLTKEGVPCPFCKKVAKHPVRREYPSQIFKCFCESCRREFQTTPGSKLLDEAHLKRIVQWTPVKCPQCGSLDCPTTSTREDFRYHSCRACGQGFRSVES